METPPAKMNSKWMPTLIAVCTLIIALFLTGPQLYQALFKKQNFTIEKVVFPEMAYDALINSTYLDETNEFIYRTVNGFYSFDVASKQQTQIVETTNWGYDYGVSENWLVWAQPVENEQKLHVINRKTNEVQVYNSNYFYGIEVKDDTLFFMGFTQIDGNSSNTVYNMMDLKTGKIEVLRQLDGEGGNSRPAIHGSRIAISEMVEMEDDLNTVITVQDFKDIKDVGNFFVSYQSVQNLVLTGNKVYGQMWNEGNDKSFIGAIDIDSGQFQTFHTSVGVDGYATDGEHFAIAVQKGDSNTVQLFKNHEGTLKRISTLPTIKERLVVPRFTEAGTLVVNGEGPDRAMYLIRFE